MAYKLQTFISRSSKAGKSKIEAAADSVSGEGCFPLTFGAVCVSSRGGKDEGAPSGLFFKDTDPIQEGCTLMTELPPKAPAPEIKIFQHMNFGGT